MISPITDHFAQAKAKLLSKYQNKPRFLKLLASYLKQIQDLEDATWDVIESRFLDTADLTRLLVIGRLVGQVYKGEEVTDYRLQVKVRILVNRSHGQSAQLIEIVQLLLGSLDMSLDDAPPAAFLLRVNESFPFDPIVIKQQISEAKGAGIGFQMIYQTFADAFQFSATSSPVLDSAHGYGSTTTPATGGRWVAVI